MAVGTGGVKNLRLILPYSAVYKMRKKNFLGDSGWNDSALPFSPGVSGVRKPVFADSFFLGSKTKAWGSLKGFTNKFFIAIKTILVQAHIPLMLMTL
ncbi:MAG: hypothetical protein CM1200mP30_26990 [Pseudomonadota bacterium]|nr:MAG: hypothetical protein CM1200mP30_26990 [Pseudomonadota bacterium]